MTLLLPRRAVVDPDELHSASPPSVEPRPEAAVVPPVGDGAEAEREWLRKLNWGVFETLVETALRRDGFSVAPAPAALSGRADLVLERAGQTLLVQCKHWKAWQVGTPTVTELNALVSECGATNGIVITAGKYSHEAAAFGDRVGLILLDGDDLLRMAAGAPVLPLAAETASQWTVPKGWTAFGAPTCPVCEAPMLYKRVRAGEHAGLRFWGCPHYPSCRAIREVGPEPGGLPLERPVPEESGGHVAPLPSSEVAESQQAVAEDAAVAAVVSEAVALPQVEPVAPVSEAAGATLPGTVAPPASMLLPTAPLPTAPPVVVEAAVVPAPVVEEPVVPTPVVEAESVSPTLPAAPTPTVLPATALPSVSPAPEAGQVPASATTPLPEAVILPVTWGSQPPSSESPSGEPLSGPPSASVDPISAPTELTAPLAAPSAEDAGHGAEPTPWLPEQPVGPTWLAEPAQVEPPVVTEATVSPQIVAPTPPTAAVALAVSRVRHSANASPLAPSTSPAAEEVDVAESVPSWRDPKTEDGYASPEPFYGEPAPLRAPSFHQDQPGGVQWPASASSAASRSSAAEVDHPGAQSDESAKRSRFPLMLIGGILLVATVLTVLIAVLIPAITTAMKLIIH